MELQFKFLPIGGMRHYWRLHRIQEITGDYWSNDYCRLLKITGDIIIYIVPIPVRTPPVERAGPYGMTSSNAAYNPSRGVDDLVS